MVTQSANAISQQQQQPFAAHKHLKQELNASLKEEGFDLSKTASATGQLN